MKGRIAIIGETGMLGQALKKAIGEQPKKGPLQVIIAAGLVGGITDNMARPVNYLRANLKIALDFLDKCNTKEIHRVIYVASSCMYPRKCHQPMKESDLWSGRLEPTNEGYAIAKLAGEALCRAYRQQYGVDFRAAILCNLYGPLDRGLKDPAKAHVIPSLIHKFTEAREQRLKAVRLMGTGEARREFMHHDDAALGLLTYMAADDAPATMNIGSGQEVSIHKLARMVAECCGYDGQINFTGKDGALGVFALNPDDGMPRKILCSRQIRRLGWKPDVRLRDGIQDTVLSR
jgi:GDP-L-fucose synthase